MNTPKEVYDAILTISEKYKDLISFNVSELRSQAEKHLLGLELRDVYGLNIDPKKVYNLDYFKIGDYMSIGMWGERHRRTLSWSSDGKQPKDERLLSICFPSGAYILSEEYFEDIFNEMWEEIKSYKYSYVDNMNNNILFSLNNAKEVFNGLNSIIKTYKEKTLERIKKNRIDKLKLELDKLENE